MIIDHSLFTIDRLLPTAYCRLPTAYYPQAS